MKLTVLGATGGTGSEIVRQAAAVGHDVTAVARRAATAADAKVRMAVGDILDPAFLGEAVTGADAVLSALGHRNGKEPTTLYSAGITATLEAMQAAGIRRIIVVSASPVAPKEQTSAFTRAVVFLILRRFFGGAYDDMHRMESIIARSDLDWTVFRPPRLVDSPATGNYRTAADAKLAGARRIPRADLAAAMLAAIDDPALYRHFVQIAS